MGKALGLTIVAEGVETVEQDRFLRDHACDEIQGFLFSKPISPEAIADLLRLSEAPALTSPPSVQAASRPGENENQERAATLVQ